MLDRLFIKDYTDINSPKVRSAYGVFTSIIGIILNVLLSGAKIAVGVIFHSMAILADGLNNLSDAGSSLVTMLGFRLANKPADKDHPFGHARYEYVASLIISFIVLFLGLELILSSVEKLVQKEETIINILVMVILGVSIGIKIFMYLYFRHMALKINSESLKATSIDSLDDAVATTGVLICSIIMYFTKVNIDGYVGIVVAVIILISGLKLLKDTISPIIGEKPNKEFVDHLSSKIRAYDGVLGIHDLVVHNYGYHRYYASVHVEVDARRDILDSHETIDEIERDIKAEGIELVIHLDPVIVDDERVNRLKDVLTTKLIEIDSRVSFHDFRVVWGEDRKNVLFDIVVPFVSDKTDKEIVEILEAKMQEYDPTIKLIVNVDRNYVTV